MNKRLTKSNNKMISGVVGGFADYLNIDPTLLRVAYVLLSVLSAAFPGILVYIILAIVMPAPSQSSNYTSSADDNRKDVTDTRDDF
jgi:phage shock protein C